MESNKKYVIGLDFGTDSCRALVVDTYTGREMATGVSFYPRWKAGLYCDAHNNRYRQHPLDYIESMTEAVHIALSDLKEEEIASICGLCFDTTGSTPALTDRAGMPLALCPEFAEEPDAMFILWKDHTAVREAEQINALINKRNLDYLLYEGGTYSSEWVWSKVLHIINTNVAIKDAAYAWVEHCDWMTGLVTGNTIPEQIFRSRCAAGHKAMWHASWGLPSGEVLEERFGDSLKNMVAVTDRHSAYFAIDFLDNQICLAHLLRNLEYLNDIDKEQTWAGEVQTLLREAIHQRNINPGEALPKQSWLGRLDALLKRNLDNLRKEFNELKRGIVKCRDYIFNFLENPEIPSDNNASERGIRKLKVKQKISGCFRSDTSADAFHAIHSIADTAWKNGQSPLDVILALV